MSLKPPDGVTLPVASFVDVLREAPLNVQYPEYGARGDDATDNTAALAAAYEAADGVPGAEVYHPPGIYLTDGNSAPSTGRLFGAGPGSTILKLADNAPIVEGMPHDHRCILTNRESTTTGFENLTIEGFELDGNVANNNSDQQTHGIELWGGTGLTIRDMYIHDVRACGVFMAAATVSPIETKSALVENIRLYNCGFPTGGPGDQWQGIAAIHARDLTISGVKAKLIASNVIDLETDNIGQAFLDCLVEDVVGEDVTNVVAIYGRSGGVCYRNIIRNVRVRDGGGGRVQAAVILDYTDGTLVDGVRSDEAAGSDLLVIPATNTNVRVRNVPGELCLLARDADQTGVVNGTPTAVEWNVETEDAGGMHDQTSAATRKKVTATVPGVYSVTVNLRWSAATGTYRQVTLLKNGTTAVGVDRRSPVLGGMSHHFPAVPLADGDYLEAMVEQDSGTSLDLIYDASYAPSLSVVKVA